MKVILLASRCIIIFPTSHNEEVKSSLEIKKVLSFEWLHSTTHCWNGDKLLAVVQMLTI